MNHNALSLLCFTEYCPNIHNSLSQNVTMWPYNSNIFIHLNSFLDVKSYFCMGYIYWHTKYTYNIRRTSKSIYIVYFPLYSFQDTVMKESCLIV